MHRFVRFQDIFVYFCFSVSLSLTYNFEILHTYTIRNQGMKPRKITVDPKLFLNRSGDTNISTKNDCHLSPPSRYDKSSCLNKLNYFPDSLLVLVNASE